jgi:hypothetical protein
MRRLVIIGLLCLIAALAGGLAEAQQQGTEEVLMALAADSKTLTIRVESGGCTEKKDFHLAIQKIEGRVPHHVLTIYRIRRDACKALLMDGVELKFDLSKDLGLSGFYTYSVANTIGAGVAAPRILPPFGRSQS